MSFFRRLRRGVSRVFGGLRNKGRRLVGNFNTFAQTHPLIMRNATKLEDLTDDERLYIKITDQSYQSNRLPQIGDYNLVYQDVSTVAYVNNEKLIISFRGTASLDDVVTDLALIQHSERESTRFIQDLTRFDGIVKANPNREIILTAHSLGGAISLFINSERSNVGKVYIINPGINLRNILQSFTNNSGNVTILRSANDPVSLLSVLTGYNVKTIQGLDSLIGTHKLDTFIE